MPPYPFPRGPAQQAPAYLVLGAVCALVSRQTLRKLGGMTWRPPPPSPPPRNRDPIPTQTNGREALAGGVRQAPALATARHLFSGTWGLRGRCPPPPEARSPVFTGPEPGAAGQALGPRVSFLCRVRDPPASPAYLPYHAPGASVPARQPGWPGPPRALMG